MTNLTSYMGIQYHYILSAKKKKNKRNFKQVCQIEKRFALSPRE